MGVKGWDRGRIKGEPKQPFSASLSTCALPRASGLEGPVGYYPWEENLMAETAGGHKPDLNLHNACLQRENEYNSRWQELSCYFKKVVVVSLDVNCGGGYRRDCVILNPAKSMVYFCAYFRRIAPRQQEPQRSSTTPDARRTCTPHLVVPWYYDVETPSHHWIYIWRERGGEESQESEKCRRTLQSFYGIWSVQSRS